MLKRNALCWTLHVRNWRWHPRVRFIFGTLLIRYRYKAITALLQNGALERHLLWVKRVRHLTHGLVDTNSKDWLIAVLSTDRLDSQQLRLLLLSWAIESTIGILEAPVAIHAIILLLIIIFFLMVACVIISWKEVVRFEFLIAVHVQLRVVVGVSEMAYSGFKVAAHLILEDILVIRQLSIIKSINLTWPWWKLIRIREIFLLGDLCQLLYQHVSHLIRIVQFVEARIGQQSLQFISQSIFDAVGFAFAQFWIVVILFHGRSSELVLKVQILLQLILHILVRVRLDVDRELLCHIICGRFHLVDAQVVAVLADFWNRALPHALLAIWGLLRIRPMLAASLALAAISYHFLGFKLLVKHRRWVQLVAVLRLRVLQQFVVLSFPFWLLFGKLNCILDLIVCPHLDAFMCFALWVFDDHLLLVLVLIVQLNQSFVLYELRKAVDHTLGFFAQAQTIDAARATDAIARRVQLQRFNQIRLLDFRKIESTGGLIILRCIFLYVGLIVVKILLILVITPANVWIRVHLNLITLMLRLRLIRLALAHQVWPGSFFLLLLYNFFSDFSFDRTFLSEAKFRRCMHEVRLCWWQLTLAWILAETWPAFFRYCCAHLIADGSQVVQAWWIEQVGLAAALLVDLVFVFEDKRIARRWLIAASDGAQLIEIDSVLMQPIC